MSEENLHNLNNSENENYPDKLLMSVPKEAFKAMFYMFTGRPDSVFKSFNRNIIIKKEDILELNYEVQNKLRNHSIDKIISTISISFTNNKAIEFSIWKEFEEKNFKIADVIDNITIKWDFLISFPNFSLPQRHTLVVKICSSFSPLQLLQALASKDPDSIEKFELEAVPCFARVDFINHILSEELIRIVEEWNKGRRQSQNINLKIKWLKIYNNTISRMIHYSLPFFGLLLGLSILSRFSNDAGLANLINVSYLRDSMQWLLLTYAGIYSLSLFGRYIASKSFKAIMRTGRYHLFEITNGDKNKIEELNHAHKSSLISFFIKILITVISNVVMAIIAALICNVIKL